MGSNVPYHGGFAGCWKPSCNNIEQNVAQDKVQDAYHFVNDVVIRNKAAWDNISIIGQ